MPVHICSPHYSSHLLLKMHTHSDSCRSHVQCMRPKLLVPGTWMVRRSVHIEMALRALMPARSTFFTYARLELTTAREVANNATCTSAMNSST
jgi:hypothetical protein